MTGEMAPGKVCGAGVSGEQLSLEQLWQSPGAKADPETPALLPPPPALLPPPPAVLPASERLLRRWCLAAAGCCFDRRPRGEAPPWLVPSAAVGDGSVAATLHGWVGLQREPGRHLLLLAHREPANGEHVEIGLWRGEWEPAVGQRHRLQSGTRQVSVEELAGLLACLAGPDGRACAALPAPAIQVFAAASWPTTSLVPPVSSEPLLEQSPVLLQLPAYSRWDLPCPGDELERALREARALLAGNRSRGAGRVEERLERQLDRWLRRIEPVLPPELLSAALEHNAFVHRQVGDEEAATLASAAATGLRLGRMLADHPLVRALARRTLLRRLGRAGRSLLAGELCARLVALLPPRRQRHGSGARGRKVLLLAVLLRSHPSFGGWCRAPASAGALDRLALARARRLEGERLLGETSGAERRAEWLADCHRLLARLESSG